MLSHIQEVVTRGYTLATKAATLTLLFTTCVTPHYRTARVPLLNTHFKVFQESDGFSKIKQREAGEEAARKPGSGQPNVLQVQTQWLVPSSF